MNSVSFKYNFIPEYSVATNPINKLTPSPEQFSQDKVSDKGAYAAKLYALIAPKINVSFEKKSVEEYKNELLGQGKFEGKDFAVKKYNFDTQLEIYENNKLSKVIDYKNDGKSKEDFKGVDMFSYPMNVNSSLNFVRSTYNSEGELLFKRFDFNAEKSLYKNEFDSYKLGPNEYKNSLVRKGVQVIENVKDLGNGKSVAFSYVDPNSKNLVTCDFVCNAAGMPEVVEKIIKNKFGEDKARINFYLNVNRVAYNEFYR